MKITVDRTINVEGDLTFTITVKEPHNAPFGTIEKNIMDILDVAKKTVQQIPIEDNKLHEDVISLIHRAKDRAFCRILDNLKFAIKHQLQPKFYPICQEIYNWIYDKQEKPLKDWLYEFDAQRTTFYFDNDDKAEKIKTSWDIEDKINEEEEEEEEDED